MQLANRIAIITGGANGIGQRRRAPLCRRRAPGSPFGIWMKKPAPPSKPSWASDQAKFQVVDVTDPDAVEAAAQAWLSLHGRIDILVNNAGILRDAQLVKYQDGQVLSRMSLKSFDDVIGVNLRGAFICTRAVAPAMIRQNSGRIINTSSIIGLYGNFGQTNYAASKAGIIGMTRVWARELGRYNITVNAVAAGFIETEMVHQMPPRS